MAFRFGAFVVASDGINARYGTNSHAVEPLCLLERGR